MGVPEVWCLTLNAFGTLGIFLFGWVVCEMLSFDCTYWENFLFWC